MRAVIVTGGNPPSKDLLLQYLKEDDYLIGVDSGCNALYDYNLIPNLILGDFDSAKKQVIDYFVDKGVRVAKFEPEKDYTDTDLGYFYAKEAGAEKILLFGATGSRLDHMIGNIGILLKAFKENTKFEIIDDNNRMFIIDKPSTLKGNFGDLIGFHAISEVVKKVNIRGAKYDLTDYDMTLFEPRAICNEFLGEDITISFESGKILVIYSRD